MNMTYWTDNIFRDRCAFIASGAMVIFLCCSRLRQLIRNPQHRTLSLYMNLSACRLVLPVANIYIYISASIIFDIPDSILKVLLLEWHCSTTFQDGTDLTGVFIEMFDWRHRVLMAQELIVNIWNTLAAQSAHSSLIARLCWLAVYLYMNRIGNTRNIMRMYTCIRIIYIYISILYLDLLKHHITSILA